VANEDQGPKPILGLKPTSQLDLENRLPNEKTGGARQNTLNPGDWYNDQPVADGYVGVSTEYGNAANDTDKPISADEGVDADVEELYDARISAAVSTGEHLSPMEEARAQFQVASDSTDLPPAELTNPDASQQSDPDTGK
jgi:hypothetical protein